MQGMQSNSTPEEPQEQHSAQNLVQHLSQRPEQRGFASALNGPLEAAKRYIERQKDNESALAAMEDEAGDGRPAWLRRWSGGVPRETESPRQSSGLKSSRGESDPQHTGQHHTGLDTSATREQNQQSASVTEGSLGHELTAGPSNGYSGHSIEAAFDFETVFQFETELEAESTDDWLDLSDDIDRDETAAPAHLLSDSLDASPSAVNDSLHGKSGVKPTNEGALPQNSGLRSSGSDRNGDLREPVQRLDPGAQTEIRAASPSGRSNGHVDTGGEVSEQGDPISEPPTRMPTPNPQAVRAAIFRLAQQSSLGQASRLHSGGEKEDTGFAEVARRVWGDSDGSTANPYAAPGAAGTGTAKTEAAVSGYETAQDALPEADAGHQSRSGFESAPAASLPSPEETASVGLAAEVQGWLPQRSPSPGTTLTGAHEEPEAIARRLGRTSLAKQEQLLSQGSHGADTFHGGVEGMQGGFSGRDDSAGSAPSLDRGTREEQTPSTGGGGSGLLVDLRLDEEANSHIPPPLRHDNRSEDTAEASQARSTQELRTAQGTAGDGPALAHDAGNLLSALRLYSELLALSGVLQARHKHYAEDLKLLAARSEALIDRLLAACTLAEQQARGLIQTPAGIGPVGSAAVSHAQIPHSGQKESVPTESSASRSRQPADRGSYAEVADRLDASFAESAQKNQELPQLTSVGHNAGGPIAGSASEVAEQRNEVSQPAAAERTQYEASKPRGLDQQNQGPAPSWPITARLTTPDSMTGPSLSNAPDPINLVDLLTRWGGLLSTIARGPVQVKFGPQAALPILVAEEAMERILVNLVHNAMKATTNGGAIRIGVGRAETRRSPHNEVRARPGNRMVLTVDDSGCGMSEEQIAQALGRSLDPGESGVSNVHDVYAPGAEAGPEPGYARPSSVVASVGGHRRQGMGLQIVRELVLASGGELTIYSRSSVGTRIEIQWPAVEEVAGLGRIPPASVGAAGDSWRRHQDDRLVQPVGTSGGSFSEPIHNSNRQTPDNARQGVDVGIEGAIAC